MTREEIGSYLGLKLETVSRVLGRLQAAKLIQVEHSKQITLLDIDKLKTVSSRQFEGAGSPSNLGIAVPFRRHSIDLSVANA